MISNMIDHIKIKEIHHCSINVAFFTTFVNAVLIRTSESSRGCLIAAMDEVESAGTAALRERENRDRNRAEDNTTYTTEMQRQNREVIKIFLKME